VFLFLLLKPLAQPLRPLRLKKQ